MDFEKLWGCAQRAERSLAAGREIKMAFAAAFAQVLLHAELLALFNALICLDLASKWLALARPLCGREPPTVWHELLAIPEARRRGIISSEEMKTRFAGKIIVYLFIAIAAGVGDAMLRDIGGGAVLTKICVGYLAAAELLSIIENLDDAGVSAMAGLLALMRRVK